MCDFVFRLRIHEQSLEKARMISERMYNRMVEINNITRKKRFNLHSPKDLRDLEPLVNEIVFYCSIIDWYDNPMNIELQKKEKRKTKVPYK